MTRDEMSVADVVARLSPTMRAIMKGGHSMATALAHRRAMNALSRLGLIAQSTWASYGLTPLGLAVRDALRGGR